MNPILELRNLSVSYGPIQALNNISIQVPQGSIVALLGPNGAGKTTLMKSILGFFWSDSTRLFQSSVQIRCERAQFKTKSLLGLKTHKIVQMGISQAPEGRMIFSDLTVSENLSLGTYAKKMNQKQVNEEFEKIFHLFPVLKERRSQLGGTLSGGEQQMLAIARAYISSPDLLLLDEPCLGVSPLMTEKIFEILVQLNRQGTSMLIAEQNARMALDISQLGYVLELGKIVDSGHGSHLISSHEMIKAYLGTE